MFNGMAAVSLVLCVAMVFLWLRSFLRSDFAVVRRTPKALYVAYSQDGQFGLWRTDVGFPWKIAGLQTTVQMSGPWGDLPCAAIFGAFPVARVWAARRQLRSRNYPTCVHCSYNLTGNVSGLCPECGKPIENVVQAKG
jgi:hypothetical protein